MLSGTFLKLATKSFLFCISLPVKEELILSNTLLIFPDACCTLSSIPRLASANSLTNCFNGNSSDVPLALSAAILISFKNSAVPCISFSCSSRNLSAVPTILVPLRTPNFLKNPFTICAVPPPASACIICLLRLSNIVIFNIWSI